jgi:hypothetical protein
VLVQNLFLIDLIHECMHLPANMMDAMMHPRLGHTYSNRMSDIGIAMVYVSTSYGSLSVLC